MNTENLSREFAITNCQDQNKTVESQIMIYWQHVKSPLVNIVFD